MSSILGTLASVGMAVGPPLVYADQAYSIVKKRDSSGFSHDVCGVIIIANIIRIFFWLGNRFEIRESSTPFPHRELTESPIALLVQSLLLIISQLFLLALCLHFAPMGDEPDYAPLSPLAEGSTGHQPEPSEYLSQRHQSPSPVKGRKRPFDFWQWEGYGMYLEFLAALIVILGVLQVIFGRWMWYIDALGFIALTIESTLPIPQFISNYQRKSTYGLRASTLAGWFFGDAFKTGYFFLRQAPIQFKVTAILTLCWDTAVGAQRFIYGTNPPAGESGRTDGPDGERLHMGDG